ncbi:hypothetical protein [Streptomyces europaeiscabiei]|uniref:hypothetical protein n=1 Tax=Streptomyces europaeiscabiei TaxID=146819 RepID=UPI0038F722ED
MSTAPLTPVSTFEDARAKARAAAGAMLPLVAYTLHAQFPAAAFLVVTRSPDEDDYDELNLGSVRDADGGIVWDFAEDARGTDPLPAVPEDIAALWGSYNPQNPDIVLEPLQRVEDTAPFDFHLRDTGLHGPS